MIDEIIPEENLNNIETFKRSETIQDKGAGSVPIPNDTVDVKILCTSNR